MSRRLLAVIAAAAAIAACSSSELPGPMLGSYHRSDAAVGGVEVTVAELQITPAGISVTAPEMRGGIDVMGKPIVEQRMGGLRSGSALFESVRCDVKTTCSFKTKDGCEGSLTLDGEDVAIVATGPCASWAGKWKRGEAKAAVRPVDVIPRPGIEDPGTTPTGAPSSSAAPPGSASGDSFEAGVSCRMRCSDEHATCALRCSAAHDCVSACMSKLADCRERCPPL